MSGREGKVQSLCKTIALHLQQFLKLTFKLACGFKCVHAYVRICVHFASFRPPTASRRSQQTALTGQ